MRCIDYEDMPESDLRRWLMSAREEIKKHEGFRNVRALQCGSITSVLKRLDQSTGLTRKQSDVWEWCEETFDGIAAWKTVEERSYRFLEESVELFQAVGMKREDAIKVIDYVYGRPVGEAPQEVGGVMITLLALCAFLRVDIESCLNEEYQRITKSEVQEKIRQKQLLKNQAFL